MVDGAYAFSARKDRCKHGCGVHFHRSQISLVRELVVGEAVCRSTRDEVIKFFLVSFFFLPVEDRSVMRGFRGLSRDEMQRVCCELRMEEPCGRSDTPGTIM